MQFSDGIYDNDTVMRSVIKTPKLGSPAVEMAGDLISRCRVRPVSIVLAGYSKLLIKPLHVGVPKCLSPCQVEDNAIHVD